MNDGDVRMKFLVAFLGRLRDCCSSMDLLISRGDGDGVKKTILFCFFLQYCDRYCSALMKIYEVSQRVCLAGFHLPCDDCCSAMDPSMSSNDCSLIDVVSWNPPLTSNTDYSLLDLVSSLVSWDHPLTSNTDYSLTFWVSYCDCYYSSVYLVASRGLYSLLWEFLE